MPSPEWRECKRRHLREIRGGWRTRDPHHRQCGPCGIVAPWVCASCEIPDLDRKAALWDACGEKLVAVAEETKRLCDEETQKSVASAIRPAWCSPMTKHGKTLVCLAEAALADHEAAEKEARS